MSLETRVIHVSHNVVRSDQERMELSHAFAQHIFHNPDSLKLNSFTRLISVIWPVIKKA